MDVACDLGLFPTRVNSPAIFSWFHHLSHLASGPCLFLASEETWPKVPSSTSLG